MDLNKLKEIQAVVFDMDGLMFDSERYADYLRVMSKFPTYSLRILQENVWDMDLWGIILSIHWEQTLQIVRNIS